ncbi:hypothetical protein ALC57_13337, partial [Trachymyrmex cornetzi]
IVPYTSEEALAFILNAGMSKDMYIQTRLGAKKRNADIYPSYERVREVKRQCYPQGVTITEKGAHIPLQNLLNHTITRLIKCITIPPSVKRIQLISKWGYDGSSGHSEYMQKPVDSVLGHSSSSTSDDFNRLTKIEVEKELQSLTDSNLFLITFVPLRLVA